MYWIFHGGRITDDIPNEDSAEAYLALTLAPGITTIADSLFMRWDIP